MNKKSILITGAASGIGRDTALLFAKNGWFVGMGDTNFTELKHLEREIGRDCCCAFKLDVTNRTEVEDVIRSFAAITQGRMTVLFNCAGILPMGFFGEVEIERQVKAVEVNLIGSMHCIHASLEFLAASENARIINMSSASSIYGTPELATYSATKFAVRGLTEALNIELEKKGIHVCDIVVPYVNTPLLSQPRTAASVTRLGVKIEAEQVARLVFKASHYKKLHWNLNLRLLNLLTWLFPFARRQLVKTITGV